MCFNLGFQVNMTIETVVTVTILNIADLSYEVFLFFYHLEWGKDLSILGLHSPLDAVRKCGSYKGGRRIPCLTGVHGPVSR
jgi:hypothetical protein